MYIPPAQRHLQVSAAPERHGGLGDAQSHGFLQSAITVIFQPALKLLGRLSSVIGSSPKTLAKRQFSSNPSRNNNIKIGLIVGFVLAAFLAIVVAFLYFYCGSMRFTYKKKKHHHHHHHRGHKSVSSRGSRNSDRSAPPSPQSAAEEGPPAEDKQADGK
ncbi:7 transmembrane receptor (rhodopsin family) domain-containing [Fusarium albosuccineum]|uniref:7 transmembrane receptor (Rhodopsin family) domain-containing n=1 Tax=Fusarium albosuccineum TaxID=1237068 RepID=A0A8H4PAM9_9HYPO|nr:7 transmembrane receptor (rhodopsin family) domain-containing [Fusarium albosuccineum]